MGNETFVSYSRKDSVFVRKLYDLFVEAAREDIWIDWKDIPPAVDWWEQIQDGIRTAINFLFILTPDSVKSVVCEREIDCAIKHNKRLIPIAPIGQWGVHEIPLIDPKIVHPSLSKLNWLFIRPETLKEDFLMLLRVIERQASNDLIQPDEGFIRKIHLVTTVRALPYSQTYYMYRELYVIGTSPPANREVAPIFVYGDKSVSEKHITARKTKEGYVLNDGFLVTKGDEIIRCVPSELGTQVQPYLATEFKLLNTSDEVSKIGFYLLKHGDRVKLSPHTYFVYEEFPRDYLEEKLLAE
jgi:hypothetical protein